MKIESSVSGQMLHKGVMETAQSQIKEQESDRMKSALDPNVKNNTFQTGKGFYFDAKA